MSSERRTAVLGLALTSVLVACGTHGDAERPRIESTSPGDGATGVPLDPVILVTFSEPMLADAGVVRRTANLTTLPHVWESDREVRIILSQPLEPGREYGLTASAFTSRTGGVIDTLTWWFTTASRPGCDGDNTAPFVVSSTPTLPADLSLARVTVVFSEPVEAVETSAVSAVAPARVEGITGTGDRRDVELSHLRMGEQYRLALGSAIRDLCGNALAPIELTFAVACESEPPRVISSAFYGHDPAADGGYLLRFSEPVSGVDATALTLTSDPDNTGVDVEITVAQVAAAAFQVDFAASDWTVGAQRADGFILTIPSGISDACGNPLPASFAVQVEAVDCTRDLEAPELISPRIFTFDTSAPAPYLLLFDENALGVVAGAGVTRHASNVGTDTHMMITGDGRSFAVAWEASDWQDGDIFLLTLFDITDACGNRLQPTAIAVTVDDPCHDPGLHLERTAVEVPVPAPNVVLQFDHPVAGFGAGSVFATAITGGGTIERVEALTPSAWLVRLAGTAPGDEYLLEVDPIGLTSARCGGTFSGPNTVDVMLFAQGDGLSCDAPHWLDSYLVGPQVAAGTFAGHDGLLSTCDPNPNPDGVIWFAFQRLTPAAQAGLVMELGSGGSGGVMLFRSDGANICPGIPAVSLGCDWDFIDPALVTFDVSWLALGEPVFGQGFGHLSAIPIDPEFTLFGGPFGEDCAGAMPLVVPGTTTLVHQDGATLDVLDAELAACEPGYSGSRDSVFSFQLTGANNRVEIDLDYDGFADTVAVVLDGCPTLDGALACGVSSFGAIHLEAGGLRPGTTYYLVAGDRDGDFWPPDNPLAITLTESEDLVLPLDGDGVAEVTGASGTAVLALPLHVDYEDDESVSPTDRSYRLIRVTGATRLVVTGRYSVEDPFDEFQIWRGPNKAELLLTSTADEGVFSLLVESDTVELGVDSDGSVSSLGDPDYEGYFIEALSYALD